MVTAALNEKHVFRQTYLAACNRFPDTLLGRQKNNVGDPLLQAHGLEI